VPPAKAHRLGAGAKPLVEKGASVTIPGVTNRGVGPTSRGDNARVRPGAGRPVHHGQAQTAHGISGRLKGSFTIPGGQWGGKGLRYPRRNFPQFFNDVIRGAWRKRPAPTGS